MAKASITGALILAVLALAGCSSASSTPGSATSTSSGSGGTTATTTSGNASGISTKGCPTAAVVSSAMGSTFTGPVTGTNGGTAPCVYSGPGGLEVNVLNNAPGLSESAFVTQTKQGIGPTATVVPGIGKTAYISSAFGHEEIAVWESPSKSFSITIDTTDATVQPDNAAQIQAIAKAMVAG